MNLSQILASIGIAYLVGVAGFGLFIASLLNGEKVVDKAGKPIHMNYFIITALVWPYSMYLLLKELESNGTS